MDNPSSVQGMAAIAVNPYVVSTYVVYYPIKPPSGRKTICSKDLRRGGPARLDVTPYMVTTYSNSP